VIVALDFATSYAACFDRILFGHVFRAGFAIFSGATHQRH